MFPPRPVAPLKVTKSLVKAPCATSATVMTEEPKVAVNGFVKATLYFVYVAETAAPPPPVTVDVAVVNTVIV